MRAVLLAWLAIVESSLTNEEVERGIKWDGPWFVDVEVVDFSPCKSFNLTRNQFYSGIIAGFSRNLESSKFSSEKYVVDILNELTVSVDGSIKSHFHGPEIPEEGYEGPLYTWQWLDTSKDIRRGSYILQLNSLCGMGGLYIPLLHPDDNGEEGKKAHMLHINPHRELFSSTEHSMSKRLGVRWFNYYDSWSWTVACHGMYDLHIDIYTLLTQMNSWDLKSFSKSISGKATYDLTDGYEYATKPNHGTKVIVPLTQGEMSDEKVCPSVSLRRSYPILFSNWFANVKEVIPWIGKDRFSSGTIN